MAPIAHEGKKEKRERERKSKLTNTFTHLGLSTNTLFFVNSPFNEMEFETSVFTCRFTSQSRAKRAPHKKKKKTNK